MLLLLGCCCCSAPSPGVETSSQKTERQGTKIFATLPWWCCHHQGEEDKEESWSGVQAYMAPGYQTNTGYKEDTIGVICVITQCQIHTRV